MLDTKGGVMMDGITTAASVNHPPPEGQGQCTEPEHCHYICCDWPEKPCGYKCCSPGEEEQAALAKSNPDKVGFNVSVWVNRSMESMVV